MAFPIISARTENPFTSSGDPLVTFTQTTGDLVVVFLSLATAQTITLSDSFTNLTNINANFHVFYKVLDGSEGGNVQVTLGTNCKAAAIAYNIHGQSLTRAPQLSTVATGTSAAPNATTVTPTGGARDYLWISAFYMAGEEADDNTWTNSAPTNFLNLTQVTSGTTSTAATNCEVAAADFTSNASSMDAGAFATDQSLAWRAYTLAVHPLDQGFAQAQAKIKAFDVEGFAQAQAKIIALGVNGFAQVNAYINPLIEVSTPSGTTDTLNTSVSAQIGDTVVVSVSWQAASGADATATDDQGTVYTKADFPVIADATRSTQVLIGRAQHTGTYSVTITIPSSVVVIAPVAVFRAGEGKSYAFKDKEAIGGTSSTLNANTIAADNNSLIYIHYGYNTAGGAITRPTGYLPVDSTLSSGTTTVATAYKGWATDGESATATITSTAYELFAVGFAKVKQTNGHAQAQASIFAGSPKGYAQAQARIKVVGINRHAQAQTYLAKADTFPVNDTFTRVEATDLGSPDSGDAWVRSSGVAASISVDGSRVQATGTTIFNLYNTATGKRGYEYRINRWRQVSAATNAGEIDVGLRASSGLLDAGIGLWLPSAGNIRLMRFYDDIGNTIATVGYTAGDEYNAVLQQVRASGNTYLWRYKFWKEGDAEPDWSAYSSVTYTKLNAFDRTPRAVFVGHATQIVSAESISITEAGLYGHAQVQAHIISDTTYRNAVMSDLPEGYFRLGEPSGATMTDETGNHTGAYIGTPVYGETGAVTGSDTAIELDGSGDAYGEVDDWLTKPSTTATIEAWIKHDGVTFTGVETTIAGWSDDDGDQLSLMAWTSDSDTLELGIYTDTGNAHYLWTPGGDTNWHHLVGTIEVGGVPSLWFDGVLRASSGSSYAGGSSVVPFRIGSGTDAGVAGTQSWPGSVDEVAVYNYELSDTRIGVHYSFKVASATTYRGYAQAQAWIEATVNRHAQAQSWIEVTANRHAQAQAWIEQTYQGYAQANAWIEQTYFGFAQAQSWIEQTYNTHAQAQGWIEQTYNGFAQAQSQIKQTYNVHAQAQAKINTTRVHAQAQSWIEQTYQGYAQAQAKINTTRVHAQAQSWIEQTYFAHSQAQAWIEQTYNGFAQSQAWIEVTVNRHAQAQAWIEQTYNGFVQSQAWIEQTYLGFAQGQAQIKQTYRAHSQAQARIKRTYNVHAQAQARIKQTYNRHAQAQAWVVYDRPVYDRYTRTTSINDYGTGDTGTTAVGGFNAGGRSFSVNGSALITDTVGQSVGITLSDRYSGHLIQFDWLSPTNAAAGTFIWRLYGISDYFIEVSNAEGWQYLLDDASTPFSDPDPDTWYTVKAWIEYDKIGNGFVGIKLWKTSDPEPDGWGASSSTSTTTLLTHSAASIHLTGPVGESLAMDNIILDTYLQAKGQAQALIKQTYQSYAQSQAWIEQTYNSFAQAQANIEQTYNVHAQAQASIAKTSQVYAQAQAWIETTYFGFAQGQAWIEDTYFGHAQGQAWVEQTYNQHAQAQGTIITTYQAYAQAQAKINTTRVHSQANAWIENTYFGHSQANAWIEATYYGHAQAQANIENTYNTHAQAQGWIEQTYNQFAQAGAWIETTYNQFAQAQGWIEQTYNQHANAQAWIEQTYQGYAQAAAWIRDTYVGCAQAQTWIKATYFGHAQGQAKINAFGVNQHAQAQASIGGQSLGHSQAQAKINAFGVQGYGQAQGWIETTYFGFAQAQGTILQTYFSHAQAQGWIEATYFGHSQSNAWIEATYNACGNAQAWIKNSYQGYSQAQADIKAVYVACGQAQGLVGARSQGCGQAQGTIKSVTTSCGQAQGTIEQTYNAHAQSQGWIEATYQDYAQANAYIKIADIEGFGQAQAAIKATINSCGQSQGQIKQIYFGHAQAQGWIETTVINVAQAQGTISSSYQAYAQAEAVILSGRAGYAQAQALIKIIDINVCAQAQAVVIKAAGYGQAQGYIRIVHFLDDVNVSDGIRITLNLSDRKTVTPVLTDENQLTINLRDSGLTLNLSDIKTLTMQLDDNNY